MSKKTKQKRKPIVDYGDYAISINVKNIFGRSLFKVQDEPFVRGLEEFAVFTESKNIVDLDKILKKALKKIWL